MYKITIKVEGLKCPMCEKHVNEAIKQAFAVKKVTSSHTEKEIVVNTKEEIHPDKLKEVINEAGYQMVDMETETYKTFLGLQKNARLLRPGICMLLLFQIKFTKQCRTKDQYGTDETEKPHFFFQNKSREYDGDYRVDITENCNRLGF